MIAKNLQLAAQTMIVAVLLMPVYPSLYVLYLILMIGIAKGGCVIYVDTYFYEYCIS